MTNLGAKQVDKLKIIKAYKKMFDGPPSLQQPALICSESVAKSGLIIEWLRALGLDVYFGSHFKDILETANTSAIKYSIVYVDIESQDGIKNIIDDLIAFRKSFPTIPLVIISPLSNYNDLSSERLPICDISMRSIYHMSQLERVTDTAIENNALWQKRHETMFQSKT